MARTSKAEHATKEREATPSPAELDRLIAEATVDAYGEAEQLVGFFTALEDNLVVPFATVLLGVAVTVVGVDLTDDSRIVAVCRRGKACQRISILDLPLPEPPPKGAEWIHALRRWVR